VYSRHRSTQIGQTVLVSERTYSIAFSREGKHLALGFEGFVRLYIVDGQDTGQDFDLPNPEIPDSREVESQCLSFAASGSRLVTATRYFPSGQVCIGIYDYDRSQDNVSSFDGPRIECVCFLARLRPIPSTDFVPQRRHKDFHLSSVVTHLESDCILLCASTDSNHTIIYQLNSPTKGEIDPHTIDSRHKPFPGHRIQRAVVKPGLTATFVLVNDANQVFALNLRDRRWKTSALHLHSSTSRSLITRAEDKMSIAITSNGVVRLFWTHGNAGILVTQEQEQDRFRKHERIELGPFQPGPVLS
jgi:hypothetical protein